MNGSSARGAARWLTSALLAAWLAPAAALPTDGGELLVFIAAPDGPAGADDLAGGRGFLEDQLPPLREMVRNEGISLRLVSIEDGAPAEITLIPLFVYQDHRGRSYFQGRHVNMATLRNFVRTARALPQGNSLDVRARLAVWRWERALVAAPIKVTELSGHPPGDHDAEAFQLRAHESILGGLERFRHERKVVLDRSSRSWQCLW